MKRFEKNGLKYTDTIYTDAYLEPCGLLSVASIIRKNPQDVMRVHKLRQTLRGIGLRGLYVTNNRTVEK